MKKITLISVFEKHTAAGTCKFKGWCQLVEWVSKEKPKFSVLDSLEELSAEAYRATLKPKKTEKEKGD